MVLQDRQRHLLSRLFQGGQRVTGIAIFHQLETFKIVKRRLQGMTEIMTQI